MDCFNVLRGGAMGCNVNELILLWSLYGSVLVSLGVPSCNILPLL